jgi:hypothetical protein
MANAIQRQSEKTDAQMSGLLVAVTNANAPRKTDYNAVIGAGLLILAIGSAAFSPMMLRLNDSQTSIEKLQGKYEMLSERPMTPVTDVRITTMESALKEKAVVNSIAIRELDEKLQREFNLVNASIKEHVTILQKDLETVREHGGQNARERISVLETELKNLKERK